MSEEALVLKDVKKVYRTQTEEVQVLKGINLTIREGELAVIMGPSGSGKSTLLSIAGGLDKPTEGRVIVGGVDITDMSEEELAKIRARKIGFVFQSFNLINRLTVLENIELPLVARGLPRDLRVKLATEALLKVGGDLSWLYKRPNQLSGGQQQRVAIARAIVAPPSILLADEPTGNLDTASAKAVVKTFRELNKLGQTIVMITHNPEVGHCAERIYMVRDGRIVGESEPDPSKCLISGD